jgi:hypothetical protein
MLEVARASAEVVLQLVLLLLRSFVDRTTEGEELPLLRDNRDFLMNDDEAIVAGRILSDPDTGAKLFAPNVISLGLTYVISLTLVTCYRAYTGSPLDVQLATYNSFWIYNFTPVFSSLQNSIDCSSLCTVNSGNTDTSSRPIHLQDVVDIYRLQIKI